MLEPHVNLPTSDIPSTGKEGRYLDTSERSSLRVNMFTVPFRDSGGFIRHCVVAMEVAQGVHHAKGWKPPKREPTINHRLDDIHGPGSIPLPASMSPEEVAYRLAQARAVHGPDSILPCCIARRAKNAAEQKAAA